MTMRITKYPQACLVVETGDARLLIDPGSFAVNAHEPETFGPVDAVLYTHRHGDHFDPRLLDPMAEAGARFIANRDVASLITDHDVTVLDDLDETTVAGVRIQAHNLEHCLMVDGTPGPPNNGYIIDERFLHPGDGVDVPGEVDGIAVALAGPDISFRDAYRMVDESKAAHVVPIHYTGFIADPYKFPDWCDLAEIHVLEEEATVELDLEPR